MTGCAAERSRIDAYLDGSLAPAERARLEDHLRVCGDCADELAALRRTVGMLRALGPVPPPPGLADRALARMRGEAPAAPPALTGRSRWMLPLGAAAAAALALVTVRWIDRPDPAQLAEARARELLREGPTTHPGLELRSPLGAAAPPETSVADVDDLLDRARREPDHLVRAWHAVPEPAREAWLDRLSSRAWERGDAESLAAALRAQPGAQALAARLAEPPAGRR